MVRPTLGHIRIEIIETKRFLGPNDWRWRTRTIENGEIGVTSEHYSSIENCRRSIRAHKRYLGDAEVLHFRPNGTSARIVGP